MLSFMLSSSLAMQVDNQVIKQETNLDSMRLYTDPLAAALMVQNFTTYENTVVSHTQTLFSEIEDEGTRYYSQADQIIRTSPFRLVYAQSDIEKTENVSRLTVYEVFLSFGSYLALVIRFSGYIMASF